MIYQLNNHIFSELERECKKVNTYSNAVFANAVNNIINAGEKVYYYIEESVNINLTDIDDYYKAFEFEYNKKSGLT